jgi:two-component sensor histidine kinase
MLTFSENDPNQLALWEMSHRFFNSLQVIDGLLASVARDLDSEETVGWRIQGVRGKVRAIAHLHRRVVHPLGFGALLENHCREICLDLVRCFGREDVTPWIQMEDVELNPDREALLLLLIVELVTNALKYSRNDGRGIIWIDLKYYDGDRLELRVRDNGEASPALKVSPRPRIAEALANSLGGDFRVSTESGFDVQVRFSADA